ncbi:hypothetical protein AB0K16_54450 [Nonomuraea jabiensis]|uniref:hypothetical protein n=1 Tax=Nonomuraea jabiensis TaxID=882448 RepID=UPI00341EA63B
MTGPGETCGDRAVLEALRRAFDQGLSMPADSRLRVSLATMTQPATATPERTYACDTHTPTWSRTWSCHVRHASSTARCRTGPGWASSRISTGRPSWPSSTGKCAFDTRDDITPTRAIDPSGDPVILRW